MARTNWQDPKTSEMRSTHISGLQEAAGKIEESVGISSVAEADIPLTEVFIANDDRCRIYQAPEGKRNWLASPAPAIKKNGEVISSDFEIDYGGGAIIFTTPALETDVLTADATYTKKIDNDLQSQISNLAGNGRTDETVKGVNDALIAHEEAADPHEQYALSTELDDLETEINNKLSTVYRYKGTVATYDSLPASNRSIGDVYNINDTGMNYAWTGEEWDALGNIEALATTVNDGLMSKEDFLKLAGVEDDANHTTINNTLTSTSTTEALSAAQGKTLKDDLDAHKADKTHIGLNQSCKISKITAQSVANATPTILTFDAEYFDNDAIHDNAINNSRLTCKTAGKYLIIANVSFSGNITGTRAITIMLNGGEMSGTSIDAPFAGTGKLMISDVLDLSVNNYIEIAVWQNSGDALNVIDAKASFVRVA